MTEYKMTKSAELFERAKRSLPGGMDSVARVPPPQVLPHPPYFERGKGSRIWDVDGNEYVDYALGFGPLILGHCPPELIPAVEDVIENRGTTFGICHNLEIEAAERVVKHLPAVDLVRFGNSGTESVMIALRLARGATGKEKIVRFEGAYHGWSDVIHWNTRSPLGSIGLKHAPRLVPGTAGIAEPYGQCLIIQPWNDPDVLRKTIRRRAHEIAAIITEPIMCNLGATMPKEGYLQFLREICTENDILLIFDEVITAFRLGLSGAQGHFGVQPDITTMAKALGGGYPVSAVGGKREIMDLMGQHAITSAGTYNGNLLCLAAVKATIEALEKPGVYERLHALGDRLRKGLEDVIHEAGIPAVAQGVGPVLQVWFQETPIANYREAAVSKSQAIHPLFVRALYKRGVMLNPGQFGVWYISTAHTEQDIDLTIEAARGAIQEVKAQL
jgi:glutamate-1-semialdehyde 2,1-aminomutase